MTQQGVQELLNRANQHGAGPTRKSNGGGSFSAKGTDIDPATGAEVSLIWIRDSGGGIPTLLESDLSLLRLDRVRALVNTYPGVDREVELAAAFEFCLHGNGSAVPLVDAAIHGLVDSTHVDYIHPAEGVAIATASGSQALTREIFGGKVGWLPWRRPGFQLGLDILQVKRNNPDVVGVILAGHGVTAWGDTSGECERNSLWIIDTAAEYIERRGKPHPFGKVLAGHAALPDAERRAKAVELAPIIRGLASSDKPMVGHFMDDAQVLDFLASSKHRRLVDLGTSCPNRLVRTKAKPMLLDLPATASIEECIARLRELHRTYCEQYRTYYEAHAEPTSPPMRGADPQVVLVPGVGMFTFGRNKQTARITGELFVNSINAMRDAEALSSYQPVSDGEKFRIEYGALADLPFQSTPEPKSHAQRIAFVTGGASGIGKAAATRLAADGACVVVADVDADRASAVAAELGDADVAVGVTVDVTDAAAVQWAIEEAILAFGGVDLVVNNAGLSVSKPLLETTEADWDIQHDVMAKGSFLVSRAAAEAMIDQQMGGDIVYIASKNSVFAGINNIAYSATKADQAHQVRLLAVELGVHGIRVNGINPDGVVQGSSIFAGEWGAQRAAAYGVATADLGAYYAQRTILKREVLPEHVAAAVAVVTSADLSQTTGLHIPVDSGIAAAFLR